MEVYLSLGSNLGDRERNLAQAIEQLSERLKTPYKALSSFLETEPWGFESNDKFINAVICYELAECSEWTPLSFLALCKQIERILGRKETENHNEKGERIYSSRLIDIDILFWGKERINLPELTIPHKLMSNRDFVMIPLKEIASNQVISSFPEIFLPKSQTK